MPMAVASLNLYLSLVLRIDFGIRPHFLTSDGLLIDATSN